MLLFSKAFMTDKDKWVVKLFLHVFGNKATFAREGNVILVSFFVNFSKGQRSGSLIYQRSAS
jgi:hypothetical protein